MKKIITLLLSLGTLTTVFAQSGYDKYGPHDNNSSQYGNHDYARADNRGIYDDRGNGRGRDMNFREKNFQIEKVNREYNWKISSVINNRNLRSREKNRIVRSLEQERSEKIRYINIQFDRYRSNDRRDNGRY